MPLESRFQGDPLYLGPLYEQREAKQFPPLSERRIVSGNQVEDIFFIYDDQDRLIREVTQKQKVGSSAEMYHDQKVKTYEYDAQGRLIRETATLEMLQTFPLPRSEREIFIPATPREYFEYQVEYRYVGNTTKIAGFVISQEDDRQPKEESFFTYDEMGNVISRTIFDEALASPHSAPGYDAGQGKIREKFKYSYDEDGRLLERHREAIGSRSFDTYSYDDKGRLSSIESILENGKEAVDFAYNDDEKIVEETHFKIEGEENIVKFRVIKKFDDQGSLLEEEYAPGTIPLDYTVRYTNTY